MEITLKDEGQPVLEVFYDADLWNSGEAISAGLAVHGFRVGQVKVIVSPKLHKTGQVVGNRVGM